VAALSVDFMVAVLRRLRLRPVAVRVLNHEVDVVPVTDPQEHCPIWPVRFWPSAVYYARCWPRLRVT
jgi:hypothetical protein